VDPRVITIQAQAPPKPAYGSACNGCGVCCLSEPCPIGMLVSRRLRGRCAALRWHKPTARYRCGLIAARTRSRNGPAGWLAGASRRLVQRWIAAGQGCDSTAVIEEPGRA
jgi:hypothetical protein